MKIIKLLFLSLLIISCESEGGSIVERTEEILPGEWEVFQFYNITQDSFQYGYNTYLQGTWINDFGSISIPSFELNFNENNLVEYDAVDCTYTNEGLVFPFGIINFAVLNEDEGKIMQCQFYPRDQEFPVNQNQELENELRDFNVFFEFYEIDIISDNTIEIRSRLEGRETIMILLRK